MPKSPHLKERILKIAGEKFLRQGFYKVSVDSLVAELRTSKSSIYKYFSSKEDLVATLIEQLNGVINRQIEQIVHHAELGFEDKLLHLMRLTSKLKRLVGPQFLEDLRIHTPELWEEYQQQETDRIQRYYYALFRQGIREGLIRNDIDLQLIVGAYLQFTELSLNQNALQGLPYHEEQIFEHLTTLFLEGGLGQ